MTSSPLATIEIGKNSITPFCGYGDESICGNTLSYGCVIFPRLNVPKMEEKLLEIKDYFEIPSGTKIHCRILFSGHQRKKTGLAFLTPAKVKKLISKIVFEASRLEAVGRFAVSDKLVREYIIFPNKQMPGLKNDDKMLLGLLSQACFNGPPIRKFQIMAKDLEIWVDKDKTQISWGKQMGRADKGYSAFSDIGAPSGSHYFITPHIVESDNIPLLQVADTYAYIYSHAYEEQRLKKLDWFSNAMRKMRWESAKFEHAQNARWQTNEKAKVNKL